MILGTLKSVEGTLQLGGIYHFWGEIIIFGEGNYHFWGQGFIRGDYQHLGARLFITSVQGVGWSLPDDGRPH